jgi:hypothetical protein
MRLYYTRSWVVVAEDVENRDEPFSPQIAVPSFVPTTEPYRVLPAVFVRRLTPRPHCTCSIR